MTNDQFPMTKEFPMTNAQTRDDGDFSNRLVIHWSLDIGHWSFIAPPLHYSIFPSFDMPLGLLGKKLGQTRVYNEQGVLVPVTVVLAGPNRVIQCKTFESDGYKAVQLGFDDQKEHRLAKPLLGHLKKFNTSPVKRIKEFRDFSREVKPGDVVGATLFNKGDFIDAIGVTKGRGFEGVVKRHHFAGGDSTHGAKGWHRRSGAIGQRLFPGTVMRGMRMPG